MKIQHGYVRGHSRSMFNFCRIKKIGFLKSGAGYTLIELMVVLSIIMILLGIITINLSHSQQKASIAAEEQVLLSDMKQQQLKAMIGDTEGRADSSSYGVHFDLNQYVLFHGTYLAGDPGNFTINLKENFQFDSPGTNIIFEKISGELSSDSSSSIVLRDTTNGATKTIMINRYGVVTQVQ